MTTNFDTLLERALVDAAVEHVVFDALVDLPPTRKGSPLAVVKVHGTASRGDSLVDLASQKRRGLPTSWLLWLEETFSGHRVVVAGFSGADLGLGSDYLRLRAAAPRTPELRWLHRPGQQPSAAARDVVALGGRRAVFVSGDLPDAWPSLGAPLLVATDAIGSPPDDVAPDVSNAISLWLQNPMVDADTCGLALCRLLDAAGRHAAAQALRTSVLTRVRRSLRAGVGLTAAARAALQIGQLAGDEPLARAETAIYCLNLAARALNAVVDEFEPEVRDRADVRDELAHDRATIYSNIANFEVGLGRAEEAAVSADLSQAHAARLRGLRRDNHDAAYLEISGALAMLAGDRASARTRWEAARDMSRRTGNIRRVASTTRHLRDLAAGSS